MTPRQIAGLLHFTMKRQLHEAARDLSIGAMAARGEPKAIKKQLKEWSKE